MFARLLAAAAAVVLLGTSAFADAVGKYSIRGTNPGDGKPYSGEVTVTKTGETCRVVWLIGSDPYTGTGIGSDDFLAVSYRSAAKPAWRCTAASPTANGTASGPTPAAARSEPTSGRRANTYTRRYFLT